MAKKSRMNILVVALFEMLPGVYTNRAVEPETWAHVVDYLIQQCWFPNIKHSWELYHGEITNYETAQECIALVSDTWKQDFCQGTLCEKEYDYGPVGLDMGFCPDIQKLVLDYVLY